MLLGTFRPILLENMLAGKRVVRVGSGNMKEKGILGAGYGKVWYF